jgi:hypothetical protein
MEIYMDHFTVRGDYFDEASSNLEKVLRICRDTNLALRNEKCFMIMSGGSVLGHHVSVVGIKVDLAKIEVNVNMLPPTNQKGFLASEVMWATIGSL